MTGVWILWTLLKVSIILAIGLGALRLSSHRRAAIRHAVLVGLFAIAVALPVSARVMPTFDVRLPYRIPAVLTPVTISEHAKALSTVVPSGPRAPANGIVAAGGLSATQLLMAVASGGAIIAFMPIVIGFWQMRRLRASARTWLQGQYVVDRVALEVGIRRHVDVRLHAALPSPVTFGVRRPVVMYPSDAEEWSDGDIERAAVHELEHVWRCDWVIDVIARAICAMYWFHPLVWIAWRQLRLESERAADDAVVRGRDATAYADLLVALADRLVVWPTHLIAMARSRDLSLRVRSLLDPSRRRERAGRYFLSMIALAVASVVLAVAPITANVRPQAQSQTAPDIRATFEVASIKATPANAGDDFLTMLLFRPGGRFVMTNSTVRYLIKTAYAIQDYQIMGGPGWIDSERYDVEATAGSELTRKEYEVRLQTLLVDRFRFRSHRETREGIEYELVAGRNGPRIKPSTEPGGYKGGTGRVKGTVSLVQLAQILSRAVHRPVVDKTGLTGTFDITLEWTPDELIARDNPIPNAAPSIFTAIEEQLGLRLESHKGPFLEVLVIDGIQKPSEN